MRVEIIEKYNKYDLERAVNDYLSQPYKKFIDVKYSSFSTRFRGEYYSAMVIYEEE